MFRIPLFLVLVAAAMFACLFVTACSGGSGSQVPTRQGGAFSPLMELDGEEPDSLEDAPAAENPIEPLEGRAFPVQAKELTIMVYMVGTDLETNGACASRDLLEMVNAQFDSERINVVVYTGGTQRWHAEIPNDRNCVLEVSPGHLVGVAQTARSLNMADPTTLSAFIQWADANYPAEHTALILWDHGGGPALGYGLDQLYSQDTLSLEEMDDALRTAGYGSQRAFDWVGFDACLMDSIEVLQVFDDYARYFVGSEELEDGAGWAYAFLEAIDPDDPKASAISIVNAFEECHTGEANLLAQPNYTLAAIDLSSLPQVEAALDGLSASVLEDFSDGDFATIAQAREQCRSFGSANGSAAMVSTSLVDIGDLAKHVAKNHPNEAAAIMEALQGAVLASATNLTGANGISMYFPVIDNPGEVTAPTVNCARMLVEYAEQGSTVADTDWTFPKLGREEHAWVIELGPPQTRNLASASYTILGDYKGRGYCPILSDVRILPDKNGVIRIPDDPEVIVTGGDQSAVVPLFQVDASPERQVFRCEGSYVLPGTDYVSAPSGQQGVTLLLAKDAKGNVEVSSALYQNDDIAVGGRANIDLLGYKTLMLFYGGWNYPDRDDDGRMLPYAQWAKRTGRYMWNEIPLHEDITFETRKASQMPNDCVVQIVLTDITGEQHASELLPIERVQKDTVTIRTEHGKLVFVLEEDHAVLDDYTGEDEVLEIPAKVKKLPVTKISNDVLGNAWKLKELTLPSTVTEIGAGAISAYNLEKLNLGTGLERIGDGALSYCSRLEHVDLPEGLRSIGIGAFKSLGAAEVRLPSTLEHLGEAAFTGCQKLNAFTVPDGCKAVSVQDGVLFSQDGKRLTAFPAGRTGVYKVPKGTEAIGYGAFASTKLESIALPEGVKTIDNCAFYLAWTNENNLTSISLPDSLESIGAYAFGTTFRNLYFEEDVPYMSELRLGRNIKSIGTEAFSGLRLGRFIVDQSNESFSSPGGILANKAGDTILEVPGGLGEVIVVPDGVTTIGEGAFSMYPAGIQVVLPNSVTRISALAFRHHYVDAGKNRDASRVYDVTFHCEAGSAAAKFAEKHGIVWDETVDPESLRYTEQTVKTENVTMSFLVYPDHAVLHGIEVTEIAPNIPLVIPAQVGGSPVVAIDSMPETYLGIDAWESVTLPATLASIDYQSIPDLCSNTGFAIEGDSETFSVKDGVLFSADGKELVTFALNRPNASDDGLFAYEVPAGTQIIGKGAFFGTELQKVSLPKSVRILKTFAFSSNYDLTDLQLNEGLERIEDQAIYCQATSISLPSTVMYIGSSALNYEAYEGFALPAELRRIGSFNLGGAYKEPIDIGADKLHIGRKLTELGQSALASVKVRDFDVDSDNKEYSSIDGLLMSKDGKTLIMCPAGRTGALHIPEGVENLEPGCLDEALGVTDVYFPDGVMGVDAYMMSSSVLAASGSVTFHCKRGSPAARYATQWDIPWVED